MVINAIDNMDDYIEYYMDTCLPLLYIPFGSIDIKKFFEDLKMRIYTNRDVPIICE